MSIVTYTLSPAIRNEKHEAMPKHTEPAIGLSTILRHDTDYTKISGTWIWDSRHRQAGAPATVFFRRTISPNESDSITTLRISADSRYKAFLNGKLVARGPCRGTIDHYHYETVDITSILKTGKPNILAVEVRWYGTENIPCAEVHQAAGLWAMLGNAPTPAIIKTDSQWRILRSKGHSLHQIVSSDKFYTDVDPIEDIDLQNIPFGWTESDFDDSGWSNATEVALAMEKYHVGKMHCPNHELTPREIPDLLETSIHPENILRIDKILVHEDPQVCRKIVGCESKDISRISRPWGENPEPLEFNGSGTHAITIDMGTMTTAYPQITLNAPGGTMVELRYSEALWKNHAKGRRDDPSGHVEGYYDIFTCREGINIIEPFVWRAFRFLKISIHHPGGSVTLKKIDVRQTNYPFNRLAEFESSDNFLKKLTDISWRTAICCAHEHYDDCPYYEQFQYIGDTRLQALVSYIVAGDFRLARQALRQFARNLRADGIMFSRSPCAHEKLQIIPNFSLIWIEFLEDFWMHSGDNEIIKELWSAVESVLAWFDGFDDDGIVRDVPYWIFTDWTLPSDEQHFSGSDGELNMRRFGAVKAASRLAKAAGFFELADKYENRAKEIQAAIMQKLWNHEYGLFADKFDGTVLGEHASILAVLYDLMDRKTSSVILERLEKIDNLARTTIYYSYYTFRAYEKMGQWDNAYATRKYLWENQLALGATTWFESPEPSRSDCHAWGCWIMCDMFTSVLGIKPALPGYQSVIVQPTLCGLEWAKGKIPTVHGTIEVAWERTGKRYSCKVVLPPNVDGVFIASNGRKIKLTSGEQTCTVLIQRIKVDKNRPVCSATDRLDICKFDC